MCVKEVGAARRARFFPSGSALARFRGGSSSIAAAVDALLVGFMAKPLRRHVCGVLVENVTRRSNNVDHADCDARRMSYGVETLIAVVFTDQRLACVDCGHVVGRITDLFEAMECSRTLGNTKYVRLLLDVSLDVGSCDVFDPSAIVEFVGSFGW